MLYACGVAGVAGMLLAGLVGYFIGIANRRKKLNDLARVMTERVQHEQTIALRWYERYDTCKQELEKFTHHGRDARGRFVKELPDA